MPSNIEVTKHRQKPRPQTPIAPPEPTMDEAAEDQEMQAEAAAEDAENSTATVGGREYKRPKRDRYFWVIVHDENATGPNGEDMSTDVQLKNFKTRTELRTWLSASPGRSLVSNTIIWGWSIEAKTTQVVSF